MATEITDTFMRSDGHEQTARFHEDAAADGCGAWVVSWCPLRLFDRNQAVTAMVLTELVISGVDHPGHKRWPHVRSFARELHMDAGEAVRRIHEAQSGCQTTPGLQLTGTGGAGAAACPRGA